MTSKTSLFRGAALGAIFALGFGAVAQAKPVKHHHHEHHMAQAGAESAGLATEVDELKAQVSVLEAKLDAQASAQQQTQAQAQQAQATAQAAASQAQSAAAEADAGIKTIPGDVQVAVAKATPKPGWWGSTQIAGTVFYDMTNIDQKSAGVHLPGTPNGVNFDIKRMYISVDHQFNSVFSANLTTDFNYDSGPASATQLYIKKAFIQAKLNNALIFRAGSADLPWVPFVEGIYGYRYVENVMIDRTKFGTSADWGLHVLGSIPMGGLTVSYAGSVVDGAGYKKPGFIGGVNHSNSMDFEGRVSASAAGFTAAVGGYDGKLGKDVQGTPIFHDATRFDALLAYVNGPIRLGGEYFHASDWNDVTQVNPLLINKTEGWSGWGSFAFTKQLSVFGRYDWVKPKDTTNPTLADNYFNLGVQYEPVKTVDFSLVYKREKISNGTFGTQEGTIGGVPDGTYDEVGLFGQIKW